MELTKIWGLNGEAFAKEVFASGFEDKYEVWSCLKEKLEGCDKTTYFTEHLLPLLKPVINGYKRKLPIQEWEDFEQEAALDLFKRISDYNPEYNDGKYLGNVFFSHVIHDTFKRYLKKLDRESALSKALELEGMADACISDTEDIVMRRIELYEALALYREMRKKYKSPYYARQKLVEALAGPVYLGVGSEVGGDCLAGQGVPVLPMPY